MNTFLSFLFIGTVAYIRWGLKDSHPKLCLWYTVSFVAAFTCIIFCQPAFAALPATGIINIQSTATAGNLNGGGFNAARGGTDYSLQDTAQINGGTDGTSNASTTFTSAAQTFTSVMVGNYLHLTAGTNGTQGWYEITAFTDAHTVTLDRNSSTGAMTNGTFYVGGAMSLGSSTSGRTDDDLFEIGVAGNIFYIKGAVTYTLGVAVNIAASGGSQNPIVIKGYKTTPGDTCTGTDRPTLACGSSGMTLGTNWDAYNWLQTGTTTGILLQLGISTKAVNLKLTNSGTGSSSTAMNLNAGTLTVNCELICYRGAAIGTGSTGASVLYCWMHDSNVGFNNTATSAGNGTGSFAGNIISSCVTAAVKFTAAYVGRITMNNNTLFGATNKTGIGVSIATGATNIGLVNSIITGFVTGVSHADTQSVGYDNYNDYQNNTADVTNWTKGANDTAVAPSFTSVGQVTGSTATTTSGNHLVQSGATFVTSGVTAGRDYVYVVSGTGVTAGIYGIASVDSETQITTDITPTANATGDKTFQITTGQNFAIGSAMKALGFPGAFQGGYSTGYMDQGAVQIQATGGGGGATSWTSGL